MYATLSSLLPKGWAGSWVLSPHHTELCQPLHYFRLSIVTTSFLCSHLLSVALKYPNNAVFISTPSQMRQNSFLGSLLKVETLDVHSTLFSPSPSSQWEVFSDDHSELCWLGEKLFPIIMQIFLACSWLCTHLGHCNFLTASWNSHKGILVHILLLSWCLCGEKKGRTSYSVIH